MYFSQNDKSATNTKTASNSPIITEYAGMSHRNNSFLLNYVYRCSDKREKHYN